MTALKMIQMLLLQQKKVISLKTMMKMRDLSKLVGKKWKQAKQIYC